MSNGIGSECGANNPCNFFVTPDGWVSCEPGTNTCGIAELLEAETSGFHDANLAEATRKINEILGSIPPDPEGRKLSLLHTNFGSLLAWVEHGGAVSDPGIRPDADNATIAKALRLKGHAASGAGTIPSCRAKKTPASKHGVCGYARASISPSSFRCETSGAIP